MESGLDVKEYADRAVQTDTSSSTPIEFFELSAPQTIEEVRDKLSDMDISSSSDLSTSFVQYDSSGVDSGAYSRDDSSVFSSPPATVKTTIRTLKKNSVTGGGRITGLQTLKSVSSRIVSLPETVSAFSARKALEKTQRIVSNPERFKLRTTSPTDDSYSDQQSVDLFVSGSQKPARVRVQSTATNMLHTPSPPSSPESILIISNKSHLAEGFLRGNAHLEESPSTQPDDDGWVSWAKSPPRPIPALHGPLSLPYARCPSGAEGTIIEEQDNLPRMIWGLEGDDIPQRPRQEVLNATASTIGISQAPPSGPSQVPTNIVGRKPLSRQQIPVPPRFHNQNFNEEVYTQPVPRQTQDSRDVRPAPPHKSMDMQTMELPQYQSVPERGPIDLTSVLRHRTDVKNSKTYPQDLDLSSNIGFRPAGHDYRAYDSPAQVELDWQSLLLTQERLKNLALSSNSPSAETLGGYVRPSLSSMSQSSLASSRSPIILDPPSQLSHLSRPLPSQRDARFALSQNTPRRMSALEIAQKYRQQQVSQEPHKQQAVLPTPPNSSSPLWSSEFSPYQESLLSPELLVSAWLPNVINKGSMPTPRQQYSLPPLGLRQQTRVPEYHRADSYGLGGRNAVDLSHLSHAHIQDINQYEDLPFSNNAADFSMLHATNRLQQSQMYSPVQGSRSLSQQSPAPSPRPPPNTPQAASIRDRYMQAQAQHLAPLSPTSPKTWQGASQQHPRSIPLSRLLQRRLSSVPEEDSGLAADRGPSPPVSSASLAERQGRYHGTDSENDALMRKILAIPGAQPRRGRSPERVSSVPATPASATGPSNKLPGGRDAKVAKASRIKEDRPRDDSREARGMRASRSRGRGTRGRRARPPFTNVVNGPERVDGGMTVRS